MCARALKRKILGIILKISPIGEYDRLITLVTREYGIVRIAAKGSRKINSRRGFHLDLLNTVAMETEESFRGSNPIPYLREISTLNSRTHIKTSPGLFAAACLIARFLLRTHPMNAPSSELFEITEKTFSALDRNGRAFQEKSVPPEEIRAALLIYFLKACRALGYLPHTLAKKEVKKTLTTTLHQLDPEFTLDARRTLGIFSSLESTRSN